MNAVRVRSDFFGEFATLVRPALEAIGFQRDRKYDGMFRLPLAPSITGWLGLNHGYYPLHPSPDEVHLTVKVGVRDERVEALLRQVVPAIKAAENTVLMTMNAVDLNAAFIAFDRDHQHQAMAQLLTQVEGIGVPWMRRHTDLAAVLDSIRDHQNEAQPALREPLALLLLDRRDEAVSVAGRAVERLGVRTDPIAEAVRELARKLAAGAV
jgi:hypothetical protein